MEIPLIIVLIIAEFLLILLGLSITFAVLLMRKPKVEIKEETNTEDAETELDSIDLGSSYIDFLNQAIQRNTVKISQQTNIENDEAGQDETGEGKAVENENPEDENTSPAPDEKQSALLQAREQFLLIEKSAADKSEHEIHFWDSLYEGLQNLIENYKTTETISEVTTETGETEETKSESKDKVFYIETQGKKIDGEVNKLKDIISEQENALSSMQKALHDAADELPEGSPALETIKEQIAILERQLSDSKMCMEVLEMENDRLQQEIDQIESQQDIQFAETPENDSAIDLEKMKEVVALQESKIQQLIETIESLEIEASQADKLKDTLKDFTRTSQEMISCIAILEEENERLQESANTEETSDDETPNEEVAVIKSKISSLEEELIKKDVAYAQLQDEFSSMETEYLAMYEALHGDNS